MSGGGDGDRPGAELADRLERAGQQHLLAGWAGWDDATRVRLVEQLETIDLDRVARLWAVEAATGVDLAAISPPSQLVRLPDSPETEGNWQAGRSVGRDLLSAGQAAVVTVAGGQGTRLGFDQPKGLFPIMPVSGKSLFEHFAETIRARADRCGARLPWLVMTSESTDEETRAFFESHDCFGLPDDDVWLFRQGNMPAVDEATGQVLRAAPGRLAMSPDGHGGLLEALGRGGLLERLADRGIDTLFCHQVDNAAVAIADHALLGMHRAAGSQVTTRVVRKRSADEPMGVVAEFDGRTAIVEYSDLPRDPARETDEQGALKFWAGNTAVHVFDRQFLEQQFADPESLPFHRARKIVPFVDDAGNRVEPDRPNAIKFERFIFDLLPRADRSMVVESDRDAEFLPVKNRDGDDSPETVRAGLSARYRSWLVAAGATLPNDVPVEISPLFALDAAELAARVEPGTRFDGPVLLDVQDA